MRICDRITKSKNKSTCDLTFQKYKRKSDVEVLAFAMRSLDRIRNDEKRARLNYWQTPKMSYLGYFKLEMNYKNAPKEEDCSGFSYAVQKLHVLNI